MEKITVLFLQETTDTLLHVVVTSKLARVLQKDLICTGIGLMSLLDASCDEFESRMRYM
jgi:hypothetical protein